MTREDDARVADLVARLGDAEATDLFRRLVQRGMQDLIDAELSSAIGAEPHERTDARTNQRNGSRTPWVNTFDVRISQELPGFFEGHKSEVWLDIMNIGNLINDDWGHIQYQSAYSDMRAVNFQGVDEATGKYIYNFSESAVWTPGFTDLESRWSLQVGFRYKF